MSKTEDWKERCLAAGRAVGVEVIFHPYGHVQFRGKLLVNYWPESRQRTAYVAGTMRGRPGCTPEQAAAMTAEPPPLHADRARRRRAAQRWRARLLRRYPYCHWCNAPLTSSTATLEHLVPLARGGLDNLNNCALACATCNHERGHEMPELKGAR